MMAAAPSVRTTCPYCGVGCGVRAQAAPGGGAQVAGDAAHPANFGRLCVKGAALGETVSLEDRLLSPQRRGPDGALRDLPWSAATDLIAERFAAAIRDHGPDSVALYVSGQLLTEDYYVANKLMKGFIGSANIDTNSRLCMASSVAGHKRAFGADVVPGLYDDLLEADLIVLVGSNLAWCHPVLHQRIAEAKRARPSLSVVNIDPRRTATSAVADRHLAIAPGGDVALFQRLLLAIAQAAAVDRAYVAAHTTGLDAAIEAARAFEADDAGLNPADLGDFLDLWIRSEKVVTVYSQGVNQWSTGVDKVNAIINCHLATGRIGRPGMGPFSVTGQPNAMGGREVGGLATMLAAHMALESADDRARVRRFWSAPRVAETPGLKAVDMFDALGDGRIKALWIMATNPAVSLPRADAVAQAIAGGAFVALSDVTADTDTARRAELLLPALAWGEKDGTVTNSERRVSRQRPFLPAPGAARPDWRIVCDAATAIGARLGEDWRAAFDYESPAEIFREHAALSGYENDGARAFDIAGYADVNAAEYEAMAPFVWPARIRDPAPRRFYAQGGFHHPGGQGRFIAIPRRDPGDPLSRAYPMLLNTGRVRDQWHTMTRTAKSARLTKHIAEPYIELCEADARRLSLSPADIARVRSVCGVMTARVVVTDRQQPGSVFAPMHWTEATASLGRVGALVSAVVDPISGQPQSKRTAVAVEKVHALWHGFAVSRRKPSADALRGACYWALGRAEHGWRVELAGDRPLDDAHAFARRLLGAEDGAEIATVEDAARRALRVAAFDAAGPIGAVFLSPEPVAAARDWVAAALGAPETEIRPHLLAGRAAAGGADQGRTLCVCNDVGERRIAEAIAAGARSLDAVAHACGAGGGCGSCRPEIGAMIRVAAPDIAAE